MNASFTNALIGEAGVIVSAEKAGVNDLDHRMRPPISLELLWASLGMQPDFVGEDLLWCDMDT